jgi:uncharacterized protein
MLSKTVKKTCHEGQEVFYNTITRKILPISASEEELKEHCFLDGMEMQAVEIFLNRPMERIGFTIIPTWECNLRCTHCTVLNKLMKKDPRQDNYEKVVDFIEQYSKLYSTSNCVHIDFVGGEPLLACQSINKYMDLLEQRNLSMSYSITTNLAVELTEEIIKFLNRLSYITISVDGDEHSHNEQRKSFDKSNPYVTTVTNVKELIKLGMLDKLGIQSALKDEYITIEYKKMYYRQFLSLGVPFGKIKFGCLHPTENSPEPTEAYKSIAGRGDIQNNVCCKFRKNQMVIDGDKLYSDYYSWDLLGTIDQVKEIVTNRINFVRNSLSVLKDDKCRSCPVIGCCWGGCVNAKGYFENPSRYCNQQKLIDNVDEAARENTLIDRMIKK